MFRFFYRLSDCSPSEPVLAGSFEDVLEDDLDDSSSHDTDCESNDEEEFVREQEAGKMDALVRNAPNR